MTHLSPQQLSAHLDSALHGASLQTVEAHLELCEKCRDELAALTLQDQMLGEALRGDSDRELFDLIGLRVQSAVHPQRARALEKSITELEQTREERRKHAEAVARRVQEQRQQDPADDEPLPAPHESQAPAAPPAASGDFAPPSAPGPFAPTHVSLGAPGTPEPDAHVSPAAELRRRALDEARARAEAEARAFALESERARELAESRVLEHAAERARHEAAARRRSEEEGRVRAAASARAEADRLARAAEAALQAAETSARDAVAAQTRAETRAVAAEEAQRQARRKAEEARRLEIELAGQTQAASRAIAPGADEAFEPATLGVKEVDAIRDWALEDETGAPAARPSRSRRFTPPTPARGASRRSTALTLAAAVVILLAAFWFAIGRQLVHVQGDQLPATAAIQTPASGGAGDAPAPDLKPAPEPESPGAGATAPEDARKSHHAAAPDAAKHSESVAGDAASGAGLAPSPGEDAPPEPDAQAEPEEEPVDLGLLCGTVRDDEKRPIAGARVMMADVGVVVVTDRVGRFCLTAPRGTRTLSVIALGFGTHRQTVSVGRRTSELNVTLRPSGGSTRAAR